MTYRYHYGGRKSLYRLSPGEFPGPIVLSGYTLYPQYLTTVTQSLSSTSSPTFTSVSTDSITEKTASNGVNIDGVTAKDGNVSCGIVNALNSVKTNSILEYPSSGNGVTISGSHKFDASSFYTDDIQEYTTSNGITIDGVLVKDNTLTNVTNRYATRAAWHVSNLVAAATNPMGPQINQGYFPYDITPLAGRIVSIVMALDDTDTVYTNWTVGTLQFIIYVDDVAQYTGTAYTKTTWDAADSYYSTFGSQITVTGLNISVAQGSRVSVAIVCGATFNGTGMEASLRVLGYLDN